MPLNTRTRAAIVLATALLFAGVAGCGNSDGSDGASASPTTADAGSADPGSSDPGSGDGTEEASEPVEACQWYTAEEMSALLGFEVTAEELETPQALGSECLYNSDAEFVGITVRPTTADDYDQLKAGAASMGLGGAQIDFPGVGDEAYHNGEPDKPNPSIAFSAKKGSDAIQVEIAAASSGGIATIDQSIEISSTIATKALG